MDSITVDFRQFDASHVSNLPRKAVPNFAPQAKAGLGASLLRSSIGALAPMSGSMRAAQDVLAISVRRPRVVWHPSPAQLAAAGTSSDITLGLGIVGSAGAGGGFTAGAGIYGSTSGEIGFYGTFGYMILNNASASAGGAYTCMVGPPSQYFAGAAFSIGVDVTVIPPFIGVEAVLYFDSTAPSPLLSPVGFGLSITYGASLIPANLTMQYTNTALRPMLLLR